jgi:hypothetical protein
MTNLKNFIGRWSRRKRAAAEDRAQAPAPTRLQTRHPSPCKGEDPGLEPEGPGGGQRQRSPVSSDPYPTALASQSEAKAVDLPLAGGGITESISPECTSSAGLSFDVSRLPPIESITAESDVRAFLAPGVPAELTRAALRRAWAADPKVRDFVGLAENAWDFNAAGAITGFGPLEMTEELRRHIAQLVGRAASGEAAEPFPAVALGEGRTIVEKSAISNAGEGEVAPQTPESEAEPVKLGGELSRQAPHCEELVVPNEVEAERRSPAGPITKRLHGGALPKC